MQAATGGTLAASPAFVPATAGARSGGCPDAKVSLSTGRWRRRGAGRRLTLAPAPAVTEVLDEADGAGWTPVGLSEMCSAGPLAGLRTRSYGSRFWALAEDLSSDEEEVDEREDGHSSGFSSLNRPSAELNRKPSMVQAALSSEADLTHNICLSSGVAGLQERRSSGGGRSSDPAAPRPWRGPLPPARVSPRLTLADVLARAHASDGLSSGGVSHGSSPLRPSPSPPAASGVAAHGRMASPSLEPCRPMVRDLGARSGVGSGGPGQALSIRAGERWAHFSFPGGLCTLLANVGRPRGFVS